VWGDRKLSSITKRDLIDYESERRRKVGDGAIRNELGALQTLRKFPIDANLVPFDKVARLIKIERPAQEQQSNRAALTEDETDQLWDIFTGYAPGGHDSKRLSRLARFGAIAIDTGSRKEAVCELKWKQVDLVNKLIHFDEPGYKLPKNKLRGKAPMTPRLEQLLLRARAEAQTEFVLDNGGSIDWTWATCLDRCPAFKDVFPHLLRHSFITQMIARGNNLYFVGKIVGDSPTTMKRYEHLQPGFIRDQMIWGAAQKQVATLKIAAE
jgi:integrase